MKPVQIAHSGFVFYALHAVVSFQRIGIISFMSRIEYSVITSDVIKSFDCMSQSVASLQNGWSI